MDSKSRALNKSPLVLAQPEMGKRAKSISYEVYGWIWILWYRSWSP